MDELVVIAKEECWGEVAVGLGGERGGSLEGVEDEEVVVLEGLLKEL